MLRVPGGSEQGVDPRGGGGSGGSGVRAAARRRQEARAAATRRLQRFWRLLWARKTSVHAAQTMSNWGKQRAERELISHFVHTQMQRILAERPAAPSVPPNIGTVPAMPLAAPRSPMTPRPPRTTPAAGAVATAAATPRRSRVATAASRAAGRRTAATAGAAQAPVPGGQSAGGYRRHKHYLLQMQEPAPQRQTAASAAARRSRSGRAARWTKQFDVRSGAWFWHHPATGRSFPIVAREQMPSFDPSRMDDAMYARIRQMQQTMRGDANARYGPVAM